MPRASARADAKRPSLRERVADGDLCFLAPTVLSFRERLGDSYSDELLDKELR